MVLNNIDLKILELLTRNGRATWSELSNSLELSSPAIAERVRRLEERNVITGYSALLSPEEVGCKVTAYIAVTLGQPGKRDLFLKKIVKMSEVQECHHIAGEDDYLLKVRCQGNLDLERLISAGLKEIPGVIRTKTTVVLNTHKENPNPPIYLNQATRN